MRLSDSEVRSIINSLHRINSNLCNIKINTANLIAETTGVPTWDPTDPNQNQAELAFDDAAGTLYYWNGTTWVTFGVGGLPSPPAYDSRAAALAALGPNEWFKYSNANLDGAVGGTVAITS